MLEDQARIAWDLSIYFYECRGNYARGSVRWGIYDREHHKWATIWSTLANQML